MVRFGFRKLVNHALLCGTLIAGSLISPAKAKAVAQRVENFAVATPGLLGSCFQETPRGVLIPDRTCFAKNRTISEKQKGVVRFVSRHEQAGTTLAPIEFSQDATDSNIVVDDMSGISITRLVLPSPKQQWETCRQFVASSERRFIVTAEFRGRSRRQRLHADIREDVALFAMRPSAPAIDAVIIGLWSMDELCKSAAYNVIVEREQEAARFLISLAAANTEIDNAKKARDADRLLFEQKIALKQQAIDAHKKQEESSATVVLLLDKQLAALKQQLSSCAGAAPVVQTVVEDTSTQQRQ